MKKLYLLLLLPLLLYSEDFIFGDNTIGVEISPVRLVLQESDMHTFSGGFSYFLANQNAELHFPIYFEQTKYKNILKDKQYFVRNEEPKYISYNEQIITFDTEYRKFIHKGFYLGGLLRVAKLWGGKENKSTMKLGLGASIGYRFVFDNSIYFGVGASFTKYFTGENHIFGSSGIDMTGLSNDTKAIFELEFLKVGYAF